MTAFWLAEHKLGEMDLVASCGLQVLEQCRVSKTHNSAQLLQKAALKELAQDIETAIY